MRIRISVEQVTPAQWEWLMVNLRQSYDFAPDDVRVCVEFVHADGLQHRHVEVEVREFTERLTQLSALTHLAEAALTPDSRPDMPIFPPYGTPDNVIG